MVGRALVRLLVGSAGTQLGLRLTPRTRGRIGPLDLDTTIGFAPRGGVRIDAPPLGTAVLPTHRGPLQLAAGITGLDPEARALLSRDTDVPALGATIATDARRLGTRAVARGATAGIVGAAAAGALVLRSRADTIATTAAGAGVLALAGTIAAATRRPVRLDDAELDGLLARAPLVLGDARDIPRNVERYRDQLVELITTATLVYRAVVDLPEAPPDDAIRLVHISDVHLSPFAFPLAKALVEQYRADAVVDTGDLVDWGTPAEQVVAAQIPSLGVPYVYVKGNHDSAGIAAAVARQPNAVVLAAGTGARTVAGLRFVGMADPRFTPDKTTGDDHHRGRVGEAGRAFARQLRESGTEADVALVHAPAAGRPLNGLVPLVLAGDIHRRVARSEDGTTTLVQGSTGGSGLRGVQVDPPAPVSLSVLHLDRATKQLWGADEITMDGLGGRGVSIVRRSLADLLGGARDE